MEQSHNHASPVLLPKDILDDLSSRFIINVPEEEKSDLVRLCFQIELAHWFYLDNDVPDNPKLPTLGMKEFARQIFQHIPTLKVYTRKFENIISQWKEYKMSVPTYGAILLDDAMEHVLLVQGYLARATWGFPKGKVNKEEEAVHCAIREVLEETGFDISSLIMEDQYVEHVMSEQLIRLYIIKGVSRDTKFQPQTVNEIKSLEWFPINALPTHKKDTKAQSSLGLGPSAFFMVIPFLKNLKKWIAQKQHQLSARKMKNVTPTEIMRHDGSSGKKQKGGAGVESGVKKQKGTPEPDRQSKQQQYFAQMCQNEFVDFLKRDEPPPQGYSKHSTPSRFQGSQGGQIQYIDYTKRDDHLTKSPVTSSSSSVAPRFQRSGNKPGILDTPPEPYTGTGHIRSLEFTPTAKKKGQNKVNKAEDAGTTTFSSSAWTNFHFDRKAILDCF